MATATASVAPGALTTSPSAVSKGKRMNNPNYIMGVNAFGGLKAHNTVASLGVPVCTEQSFAKVVSSLRSRGKAEVEELCLLSAMLLARYFRLLPS